jgi:hypothetical protein
MSSRAALLPLLLALAAPAFGVAQSTSITVAGFPLVFPTPTGADFVAGFIQSTSGTPYTVDATLGAAGQRTTIVSVRCSAPCPAIGSKPLASLQWSRQDLGTWQTLTTTDAFVEQRVVVFNGSNDPWSNTLNWRFLLNWTGDPPGGQSRFNIRFTLTVTVP